MSKKSYPLERRIREGQILQEHFSYAKKVLPNLTRKRITDDMKVSPAMFSQWVSGRTRISDVHLIYLGGRLGFDVASLRPELESLKATAIVKADAEILEKWRHFPLWKRTLVYDFIDLLENY